MKKLLIDEWVKIALKERGIFIEGNKFRVEFYKGKTQIVSDLPAAIRQQKHIIDQQKREQKENEDIGILMRQFHETVISLSKMLVQEYTEEKKTKILEELRDILEIMSRKREDLRKDGYVRLTKVYKMIERGNLPAANVSSLAALSRMRRRWLVNERVIDKSLSRYEALKNLSKNLK